MDSPILNISFQRYLHVHEHPGTCTFLTKQLNLKNPVVPTRIQLSLSRGHDDGCLVHEVMVLALAMVTAMAMDASLYKQRIITK